MKKIALLLIILFVTVTKALALDVVYPKNNPCTINASSTFFIGSTYPSDKLKINNVDVKISPSGAFAQVVPLCYGTNNFELITTHSKGQLTPKSVLGLTENPEILKFSIVRPKPTNEESKVQTLVEYPLMNNFYVKKDSTPLRTTPVDSGINRMAILPKEMQLLINGEKCGFYRVYLTSKQVGWVAKSDIEQRDFDKNVQNFAKILSAKVCNDSEFDSYEFVLDRKLPFTVKEENGLTLQLFNVDGQPDNVFSLNLPLAKLVGYDAYYSGRCFDLFDKSSACNSGGERFIFKVRKAPAVSVEQPLKNIVIAIDAGHGGNENGAIGCCGDKEKDINLAIAQNLRSELKARGAKVVMTREGDFDVSLSDRVNYAKANDAMLSISIHANAIPDGADPLKNRGTSVYFYHNQAKPLAFSILNSMTSELGLQNDKVRQASLALVRPTACVSVLIEVAYIINPDDYALLVDKDFQEKCAKSIADGIQNYLLK